MATTTIADPEILAAHGAAQLSTVGIGGGGGDGGGGLDASLANVSAVTTTSGIVTNGWEVLTTRGPISSEAEIQCRKHRSKIICLQ